MLARFSLSLSMAGKDSVYHCRNPRSSLLTEICRGEEVSQEIWTGRSRLPGRYSRRRVGRGLLRCTFPSSPIYAEKTGCKNIPDLEIADSILDALANPVYVRNSKNQYVLVNDAFCNFVGKSRQEILGKTPSAFFPQEESGVPPVFDTNLSNGSSLLEIERVLTVRNGKKHAVLGKKRLFTDMNGENLLIGNFIDVTERKHLQEAAADSLQEKELLLKEIHHRVKNNFQTVISLIKLQGRLIPDPEILTALLEIQNRIRVMALVHEKLYRSPDLSGIDLGDFIRSLAKDLIRSNGAISQKIRYRVDIPGAYVDTNTAIPLGLIANELITNAFKYAFPDERKGDVEIWARKEGHLLTMIVQDNGIGIPATFDWRNADSLGLLLVNRLVEQIDGEVDMYRSDGTTFVITVKVPD